MSDRVWWVTFAGGIAVELRADGPIVACKLAAHLAFQALKLPQSFEDDEGLTVKTFSLLPAAMVDLKPEEKFRVRLPDGQTLSSKLISL